MKRRLPEVVLWMVTTAIVVSTIWRPARAASPDGMTAVLNGTARASVAPTRQGVLMFDDDTLARLSTRTVERDPFRLDRRPTSVPYSTAPSGAMGVPATPAAPPVRIVLQGIIGGPPWQAILSGVPGHEGTVIVRSGDTLGGIAIRKITRDSTVIRMKDSTWAATLAKRGT